MPATPSVIKKGDLISCLYDNSRVTQSTGLSAPLQNLNSTGHLEQYLVSSTSLFLINTDLLDFSNLTAWEFIQLKHRRLSVYRMHLEIFRGATQASPANSLKVSAKTSVPKVNA